MCELKKRRIYFARHAQSITGRPDIVFRTKKIAIFIDSDFWHGHPKRGVMPKTNVRYWCGKIARNRKRDKEVNRKLKDAGWKVIRLWEYDIKHRFEKSIQIILNEYEKRRKYNGSIALYMSHVDSISQICNYGLCRGR